MGKGTAVRKKQSGVQESIREWLEMNPERDIMVRLEGLESSFMDFGLWQWGSIEGLSKGGRS